MRNGWTFVLLLACAAPCRADALDDARRHYQSLKYDQALAAVADAKRGAVSPRQLGEALLLEGFVEIALDREPEGLAAFREAIRRFPSLSLPANSSPKLEKVFDRAREQERERAQQRAAARLRILTPRPPEVAVRAVDVVAQIDHPFPGLSARLQLVDDSSRITTTLLFVADPDGRWLAHIPPAFVGPDAHLSLRGELVHEGEVIARFPEEASAPVQLAAPAFAAALRIESPMIGSTATVDGTVVGRLPIDRPVPVRVGRRHVEITGARGRIAQDVDVAAGEVGWVQLRVERASRLPVLRYLLLGLGSVLVVTGGVLFDQSGRATAQFNDSIVREPVSMLPTTDFSRAASAQANARAFESAAIATVAVGGAAILVGLALFAIRGERRPLGEKRLSLAGDGLGVTF